MIMRRVSSPATSTFANGSRAAPCAGGPAAWVAAASLAFASGVGANRAAASGLAGGGTSASSPQPASPTKSAVAAHARATAARGAVDTCAVGGADIEHVNKRKVRRYFIGISRQRGCGHRAGASIAWVNTPALAGRQVPQLLRCRTADTWRSSVGVLRQDTNVSDALLPKSFVPVTTFATLTWCRPSRGVRVLGGLKNAARQSASPSSEESSC